MAVEIKIGGVTYNGTSDFNLKEQAGSISTTQVRVILGANPIPQVFQRVQVYLDSVLYFTGIIQRVGTPEYSTTYEAHLFSIDVSSLECLLANRLVTKNFYYYSYTSWAQVVSYLFSEYIADENITLGSISSTSATFDSKYSVKNKKLSDVLNEIADAIGNASWWISADNKFYFKISTDFTAVTPPTHLTKLSLTEAPGDIRTVEDLTGASGGVNAVAENTALISTIAARSGGSGRIEIAETDSDIHSDAKAATEAAARLAIYNETEKDITCICQDLTASKVGNSWDLDLDINGVAIAGVFVITDRSISYNGPDAFNISVTLKNNNYFTRYGYKARKAALLTLSTESLLSDIASDGKLTAAEKIDELPRWNTVAAEYPDYIAEAAVYGVSSTAYAAAFQALANYLNGGVTWISGTPAWFAGEVYTETTDIVGATYDATWQAYADAKATLESAIRAAIQASADEGIANAHNATRMVTISAPQITRARTGTLTPATLAIASKYGDDNTAYAGRFIVSVSTDGSTYTDKYSSAGNESSYSYTVPASESGNFVIAVRVRLYEAGGFDVVLDEKVAGIVADSNTAPLYWGALTTAPTSNVVVNDYYFDSNVPESGGGVIRYWSGSAWVQSDSSWTYWATAWKTAIADATKWATDNNATLSDVSAFMNAVIGNAVIKNGIIDYLATSTQVSTALCDDGTTRRMETDWDNATTTMRSGDQDEIIVMGDGEFTSYSGIGAARRALRHSGATLGWYDSPEGGVESLIARLSRGNDSSHVILGDGIKYDVKADSSTTKTLPTNMNRYTCAIYNGQLFMPQSGGTTLEIYDIVAGNTTIKTLPTNMNRYTCAIYNGQLFMPQSGGTTLEIYDIAAGNTTIKTLPTSMTRGTCAIYNGQLFMPQSGGTTLEIYDIAAGNTTIKTLPTSMTRGTCAIYNGQLFMPQINGTGLEIYDIAAGTTTTKTLPTNMYRYASAIYNGQLFMAQDNGTTLEIYDIAADSTTTKTLPTNMYRNACAIYNGKLFMPQFGGTTLEIYDIAAGTTTTKTLPTNMYRTDLTIYNGQLFMPQDGGTTLEIYSFGLPSQVGAGIIESGSNANGSWVKFSDGTFDWNFYIDFPGQAISTQATAYTTCPFTPYSYDNFIFSPKEQRSSGQANMIGLQAYNGIYMYRSGNNFGLTSYSYRTATTVGTDIVRYYCRLHGRWKA